MLRFLLGLLVLSASAAAHAQAPLAVSWSSDTRWFTPSSSYPSFDGSDNGAHRLFSGDSNICRSSVAPQSAFPVAVRFDSTETTLMGRGAPTVDAVGTFPGSAWDVTDPATPRRLNLLLRESSEGVQDTSWTPGASGEGLIVMTSSYDGTGTSYAGRNLSVQTSDCMYSLALRRTEAGADGIEMDVRPARVWPLTAYRSGGMTGSTTTIQWTYAGTDGASVRVRRATSDREVGRVIATLPPSARQFTDGGYAPDTLYRYRIEVVDAQGRRLQASPFSQVASIRGSSGLTVLGVLNTGRYISEVWGYVGPDGREYALLNSEGLTVVDVTDPANLVELAHVEGGTGDIEAYGHYVYVTGDGAPVQVIDISDPSAPVLVREFRGHPDQPTAGVHTLSIDGDRMYLNGNVDGLSIWSLADPTNPVYLSTYRTGGRGYVHDVLARGDTVYAALIDRAGGVDVVDVSDPTRPVQITNFTYPEPGAHNICSTADGRYLFVGDEIGLGRWTRVFDVSDLDNVELVAEMIVNPLATVHNCHRLGDLLYVGHYGEGVRVWNIADPTQPVEVAFYNGPEVGSDGHGGIWSAWPYLPSGRLLASDFSGEPFTSNGLLVLELDGSIAAEPQLPDASATLRLAPNPTTGTSTALITLAVPTQVVLTIHDLLGRRVAALDAGRLAAGEHRLEVPSSGLPAGVYIVRVTSGPGHATAHLTVAR